MYTKYRITYTVYNGLKKLQFFMVTVTKFYKVFLKKFLAKKKNQTHFHNSYETGLIKS